MYDDKQQFQNQIISKKSKKIDEEDNNKRKNKKNKKRQQIEPTSEPKRQPIKQQPLNSVKNSLNQKDKKVEQDQIFKELCCILSNYKSSTIREVLINHNYNKTQSMNHLLQMPPDNEKEQFWESQVQKAPKLNKKKSGQVSISTNNSEVANNLINEVYDNFLKEDIEDINGQQFEQLFEEIAEMIKQDQRGRGVGVIQINNFVDQCNSVKQTLLVGFREQLSSFDDFYQFDESYPLVAQTQEFLWAINKKQVTQEKRLQEDFPSLGFGFESEKSKKANIVERIHQKEKKKKQQGYLFTPSKNALPYYAKEKSNQVSIFNVDNKLNSQRDLMSLHKEFSDVPIRDLKFAYQTFAGDYNICRQFLIKYYDDKRKVRTMQSSQTYSTKQQVTKVHTSRLKKQQIQQELKHLSLKQIRDQIDHLFKLRQALQITKMKIKSSSQKQELDRMINEKNPLIKKLALASRIKQVQEMRKKNPLYIDLHGYREEQIDNLLDLVTEMLCEQYERRNEKLRTKKLRNKMVACLIAMTGKGRHSRGNKSILKPAAIEWCHHKDFEYEEEQDHIKIYVVIG